ncbi:MAG: hypothetical protein JST86_11380 [Bacteroidetes bacterium]|nr:hypothetical protein [Bacteroidota bacterium]
MKFLRHTAAILVIIFIQTSCKAPQPLLSNHEKGTYNYNTTNADVVNVTVSVLPLVKPTEEPEKPKTFLDLKDSLPQIYLKLLAAKEPDPVKFMSYLSKPLIGVDKKPDEGKPTDYTKYKLRFVFTNLKKYYNDKIFMHPNTRLEFLTTSLGIPSASSITFYNIDKLENEFDEIDLGSLTRDQTVTLNTKISGEAGFGNSVSNVTGNKNTKTTGIGSSGKQSVYDENGNVIGTMDNSGNFTGTSENSKNSTIGSQSSLKANAEASYMNTETIKEAIAVKLKRLRTGFNFSPKNLTIAQRGRPMGDISDNIYVTTTLSVADPINVLPTRVYDFGGPFNQTGNPIKADELTFTSRLVNFVPCDAATTINLTTSYEGAIRVVDNDSNDPGEHALEYDDKVTFYKFKNDKDGTIELDKNVYCKDAFIITAKNAANDRFILNIATPVSEELNIFVDDNPRLFLSWVLNQIEKQNAADLSTTKYSMYFENTRTHDKIYLVKAGMTTTDLTALRGLVNINLEKRRP